MGMKFSLGELVAVYLLTAIVLWGSYAAFGGWGLFVVIVLSLAFHVWWRFRKGSWLPPVD